MKRKLRGAINKRNSSTINLFWYLCLLSIGVLGIAAIIGSSGGGGSGGGSDDNNAPPDDTTDSIPASELEDVLLLNELYFEYANRIGDKVWVLGFYGNVNNNDDGIGFLVDNMLRLEVDEVLPHHSFARIDGDLPPEDWEGSQILVYGEIKDFITETGQSAIEPIPLITVEDYEMVSPAEQNNSWDNTFLTPDVAPEPEGDTLSTSLADNTSWVLATESPDYSQSFEINSVSGTQAQDCDRSVIISGGVDASNNHRRYIDNVIAKFNKMKELGFSDDQIEVFYNNREVIDVDAANIVDDKTSKAKLQEHFTSLASEMSGSCTLTIFVTDHGTGYNMQQGYEGARPALSGSEATSGKLFDENTFIFDARAKTYRSSAAFNDAGSTWFITKEEDGTVNMFKRVDSSWVFKGKDTNGSGIITETELGGEDLNGDGDGEDGYGYNVAVLEARLSERKYRSNKYDTDRDGNNDVRLRFDGDGSRFVVERLDGDEWKEMGRDTNGDYFIDIIDGGVDWNLDGDKADQIGFHEGINLWGNEVLWDDEFANMIKPLSDKGVHIMMEMVSCFSGGFVPNVEGLVENIYTGSSEDTKHYNRYNADRKIYAADEMAFLENLSGIDTDSWNAAASAATAADDTAAGNGTKNIHVHEQIERFKTQSLFQAESESNEYTIQLDLPDSLVGKVYDFEFITGLQKPRWTSLEFPQGLRSGLESESIPGGTRVYSMSPIADGLTVRIKAEGVTLTEENQIRIELTDIDHTRLGYTIAQNGEITVPSPELAIGETTTCVNHTPSEHGQSSPSVIGWLILASTLSGYDLSEIQVTVKVTTPSGSETFTINLDHAGYLYVLYGIYTYGAFTFDIQSAVHVPSGTPLVLTGQTSVPINVTSSETHKEYCVP